MLAIKIDVPLVRCITFIAFMVVNFSVSSFAQTNDLGIGLTQAEKTWISENSVIRVSNSTAIPPFNFTRNGKVNGFTIDYIKLLGTKTGLHFEYPKEKPWNDMMNMLLNKEIDLFHSVAQTPEREKTLKFTAPYLEYPMVNFGRVGAEKINTVDDLKDRKIGLITGFKVSTEYREKYPDLDYVEYDTIRDALQGLSSSEIDLFTSNIISINYTALQNFIPNLELIGNAIQLDNDKMSHHLSALPENEILIQILSKAMLQVTNDEYINLTTKWQTNLSNEYLLDLYFTEEERRWLRDHQTITVANPSDSAPFSYTQNNVVHGIAIDYLDLITSKLNLNYTFAPEVSWNETIKQFKDGEIDLLHSANIDEERAEFAYEACVVMRNRFGSTNVMKHYGWNVDEAAEIINQSEGSALFNNLLFTKIMPNLKRIGLLTDKVSKKYEEMGILEFQDLDNNGDTSWEELSKPLDYGETG